MPKTVTIRRSDAKTNAVGKLFADADFGAQQVGGLIKVKGQMYGLRQLIQAGRDPALSWSKPYNNERNRSFFSDGDDGHYGGFQGGSVRSLNADLAGKKDITPHIRKMREMEASGLLRRIRTVVGQAYPKRRRVFSEHDGDWDHDRQWDVMPFQATSRPPQVGRTLTLDCDMCVNGGTDSKDLDAYGVLVWAISNIIESAGICTRIVYTEFTKGSTGSGSNSDIQIVIKQTSEYIAPPLLAAVFQTNFFRRVGFSLLALAADAMGETVTPGMGRAATKKRTLEYGDGVLQLHPDLAEKSPENLERMILEAARGAV